MFLALTLKIKKAQTVANSSFLKLFLVTMLQSPVIQQKMFDHLMATAFFDISCIIRLDFILQIAK